VVDGYVYLGQQTPAFYAKQIVASLVNYGKTLLPPFFGGLMAYDSEANIAFDCPGHQGGQFYRKSPAGQIFFKYFGESIFRNDLCNADVDLGDLPGLVSSARERFVRWGVAEGAAAHLGR
jgi:ornithine decarboxylase